MSVDNYRHVSTERQAEIISALSHAKPAPAYDQAMAAQIAEMVAEKIKQGTGEIAPRGKAAEHVFQELHLVPNGNTGNFYNFPMAGLIGEDCSCIITAKRCDHVIIHDKTLKSLSKNCTIVACSVEEHVSYSYATLRQNEPEITLLLCALSQALIPYGQTSNRW